MFKYLINSRQQGLLHLMLFSLFFANETQFINQF